MTTYIQTEIPDQLWKQAQSLVQAGWINNMDALVTESIRRYIESHQQTISEDFIREDVRWGLDGKG